MTTKTSSNTAALAGFLLGSSLTLAISVILARRSSRSRRKLPSDSSSTSMPSDLRDEQLSRHTLYFGQDGMEKLKGASVIVVGLGGVGSHAANMLARGGVARLRLIDFDQVTLSSLNRHACATLKDVGTPKAKCLQQFLQSICPDRNQLNIEAICKMYTADDKGKALLLNDDGSNGGVHWDLVIDAIDDVPTKAALLAHCVQLGIRVVSCMGAGGKSDVTRLHISDLKTASRDPLASKLRQSLKRQLPEDDHSCMEDMERLAVVFSSEKTVMKLADFTDEQKEHGVHQFGAVDGMRIRVLPVLGTMPAIMGMACAAMALCELGDKPFSPVTGERVGRNVRHKLLQRFQHREKKISDAATEGNGQWTGPVQIDLDDVEFLMELWRNRCAVTGDRLGTVLHLVRWDMTQPSTCSNIVLMGVNAVQKYDKAGKATIPTEIQTRIELRLRSCRLD